MWKNLFGGKQSEPVDELELDDSREDASVSVDGEAGQPGFFDRMKEAVTRTRESLSTRLEGVLALTREIDEAALEELESALLTSDIGMPTTTAILEQLRERALRRDISGGAELRALLKEQIRLILDAPGKPVPEPATPPK